MTAKTANVMLTIPEKKTVSLDLYRPLRNYIVYNYSEREAQNLEDDLQTLKQFRSDIERGPNESSLPARRDLLQNYYKALCAVESRFPISPDQDHINSVTFTWYDAFKNKLKAAQQNIYLGISCNFVQLFFFFLNFVYFWSNCMLVDCTINNSWDTAFYCAHLLLTSKVISFSLHFVLFVVQLLMLLTCA